MFWKVSWHIKLASQSLKLFLVLLRSFYILPGQKWWRRRERNSRYCSNCKIAQNVGKAVIDEVEQFILVFYWPLLLWESRAERLGFNNIVKTTRPSNIKCAAIKIIGKLFDRWAVGSQNEVIWKIKDFLALSPPLIIPLIIVPSLIIPLIIVSSLVDVWCPLAPNIDMFLKCSSINNKKINKLEGVHIKTQPLKRNIFHI